MLDAMNTLGPQIRCRKIIEADLERVADLLTHGFVDRPREYWMRGLRRMATRDVPQGYPRFGYLLENQSTPVGVLLQIYSLRMSDGEPAIYCNLSSWYVEPAFRFYAPILTKTAQRHSEVTYINISPARWTWPIVEIQAFHAYCEGLFLSFPALCAAFGVTVEIILSNMTSIDGLAANEVNLLRRHAGYGCLSLICRSDCGVFPFILQPMRIRRGRIALPAMQLIYCRDIAEFVACAGAIGRLLLRRGKFIVSLDANGRLPGLIGLYTKSRGRKYFKGPQRPRLADLRDTELALFGL
jgi:hypothetical protein